MKMKPVNKSYRTFWKGMFIVTKIQYVPMNNASDIPIR